MEQSPESGSNEVGVDALREILSSYEAFSGLSDAALAALAGIAERMLVPGGKKFASVGDRIDWAYAVEHGRVRLEVHVSDKTFTAEIGRGEFCGLATVLRQVPSEGNAWALRDSKLIRLRGSKLLACMAAHPELIVSFARYATDMSLRTHGVYSEGSRPQFFTVLPASDDTTILEATGELQHALSESGTSVSRVDRRRLEEVLGGEVPEGKAFEHVRQRLVAWCGEQEAQGRLLLFVCDPADTSWTRWCLQQTDRIVVATTAEATSEIDRIDATFAGRELAGAPVKVDLLLLHDRDTELPRGTEPWMQLACRRRHHHVRPGHTADFRRAARRMSERAVGVVLGGGGARGLAHVGVLQALEEAGIPVDVIGGTSMGSVMAAAYARGWSPKRILQMLGEVFHSARAVMDLDFPMVSILGGRKLNRVLRSVFADVAIADLWIPYYCISSSLTEARMVVHDRGSVWRSVRASCSLPGIFPPVQTQGELLVDGGVVNNVPMDVMGARCEGGTVIAVDVGGGGARDLELGDRDGLSGWALLRNRLNPGSSNERIANIFQILTWATTLSSKQYLEQLVAQGQVDLLLTPPVQEFPLLGFDRYEKLYEIGYEYARKRLAEWEGLLQPARAARGDG